MKPQRALAAITIGLVLVVVGFTKSNRPSSHTIWFIAIVMMLTGLAVVSVGLVGLARGVTE